MKLFKRGVENPGSDWSPPRLMFAAFALVGMYSAFQLLVALSHLWVMMFGAVVIAVIIRSVADPIIKITGWPSAIIVIASILLIIGLIALALTLFGSEIANQGAGLVARIPVGLDRIERLIGEQPFAAQLQNTTGQLGAYAGRALGWAQSFAMSIAAAVTGLLLVSVAGIYLALSPAKAREGLVALVPIGQRARFRHVLDTIGRALKGWLKAQIIAMMAVGLMSGIGLSIIGVPSPVALGVLTGLLNFVPIVGPILATVPAVLMAATVGWEQAAFTLLLYFAVQQIESVLIVPLVQKNVASLPVIVTIFSVVAFGTLFGPLGVMLSGPLALTLFVLVIMVYRQNVLGDWTMAAPGEADDPSPPKRTS